MSQAADHPRLRLIAIKTVTHLTSLSASSIYRMVAAGKFPAPIPISEKRVVWIEGQVVAWMHEQIVQHEPHQVRAKKLLRALT